MSPDGYYVCGRLHCPLKFGTLKDNLHRLSGPVEDYLYSSSFSRGMEGSERIPRREIGVQFCEAQSASVSLVAEEISQRS